MPLTVAEAAAMAHQGGLLEAHAALLAIRKQKAQHQAALGHQQQAPGVQPPAPWHPAPIPLLQAGQPQQQQQPATAVRLRDKLLMQHQQEQEQLLLKQQQEQLLLLQQEQQQQQLLLLHQQEQEEQQAAAWAEVGIQLQGPGRPAVVVELRSPKAAQEPLPPVATGRLLVVQEAAAQGAAAAGAFGCVQLVRHLVTKGPVLRRTPVASGAVFAQAGPGQPLALKVLQLPDDLDWDDHVAWEEQLQSALGWLTPTGSDASKEAGIGAVAAARSSCTVRMYSAGLVLRGDAALQALRTQPEPGDPCDEWRTSVMALVAQEMCVAGHGQRTSTGGVGILMEWMPHGTVYSLCMQRPLALHQVCGVLADVVDAAVALHGRGGIHRDIKPQNVMLDLPDASAGPAPSSSAAAGPSSSAAAGPRPGTDPASIPWRAKVADYGLATMVSQSDPRCISCVGTPGFQVRASWILPRGCQSCRGRRAPSSACASPPRPADPPSPATSSRPTITAGCCAGPGDGRRLVQQRGGCVQRRRPGRLDAEPEGSELLPLPQHGAGEGQGCEPTGAAGEALCAAGGCTAAALPSPHASRAVCAVLVLLLLPAMCAGQQWRWQSG
jgi:hypothetical protein